MKTVPAAARGLSEREVFALTLHHEAASEGARGMAAVGCIIRNRVAWGKWGHSYWDVCLARKQFSCWRPAGGTVNYGRLVEHADELRAGGRPLAMQRAFNIADAVMGGTQPDLVGGADHYWAPAAMIPKGKTPEWAIGVTPVLEIGRHRFIRLRPTSAREIAT